jgi:hypothetical protein
MKRLLSVRCALSSLAAAFALALHVPSVLASAEGLATAGAWAGGGGADIGTPIQGCEITTRTGTGFQQLIQSCGVPSAGTADAHNLAYFQAPSVFDPTNPSAYQLARLGTYSGLGVEVHSNAGGTGRSIHDPLLRLTAQTSASYLDYLMLGSVRPASLQLDFHLSGELRLGAELNWPYGMQVDNFYGVDAQSGFLYPDGSFGSTAPYAYGGVSAHRQLAIVGGTPTVTTTINGHPMGATTFSETANPMGGTDVRVTLGADYFANSAHNAVSLGLRLASYATGPAWSFKDLPYGTLLTGNEIAADFANTFTMVGLQAFDENGQDITSSAVLGFHSLLAVPEPGTWALWLAGLGGVVVRRSRAG